MIFGVILVDRFYMIPSLIGLANSPYDVLPAGIHFTKLADIKAKFVYNDTRTAQFEGLVKGIFHLQQAGCQTIFLDGSYVSSKEFPGDFDVIWSTNGVAHQSLPSVLSDFSNGRLAQKKEYMGEFFPDNATGDGVTPLLDFFQTDRYTGRQKGILGIDLTREARLLEGVYYDTQ